jgi:hypothetical protein
VSKEILAPCNNPGNDCNIAANMDAQIEAAAAPETQERLCRLFNPSVQVVKSPDGKTNLAFIARVAGEAIQRGVDLNVNVAIVTNAEGEILSTKRLDFYPVGPEGKPIELQNAEDARYGFSLHKGQRDGRAVYGITGVGKDGRWYPCLFALPIDREGNGVVNEPAGLRVLSNLGNEAEPFTGKNALPVVVNGEAYVGYRPDKYPLQIHFHRLDTSSLNVEKQAHHVLEIEKIKDDIGKYGLAGPPIELKDSWQLLPIHWYEVVADESEVRREGGNLLNYRIGAVLVEKGELSKNGIVKPINIPLITSESLAQIVGRPKVNQFIEGKNVVYMTGNGVIEIEGEDHILFAVSAGDGDTYVIVTNKREFEDNIDYQARQFKKGWEPKWELLFALEPNREIASYAGEFEQLSFKEASAAGEQAA